MHRSCITGRLEFRAGSRTGLVVQFHKPMWHNDLQRFEPSGSRGRASVRGGGWELHPDPYTSSAFPFPNTKNPVGVSGQAAIAEAVLDADPSRRDH